MTNIIRERRKQPRKEGESFPVFIEIEHSFGSKKKSIYKIKEFDEHGLSFFVPYSDGYFMVGTPLKFYLIKKDGGYETRIPYIGKVCYYLSYYENNEKYFKIGVELLSSYRDVAGKQQQLRPYRYGNKDDPLIKFNLDSKSYQFRLIDFSKYSAAFYCDSKKLFPFRISSVLTNVQLIVKNNIIFEGIAIIFKVYQDSSGKNRIIIEPRGNLINIDYLEKQEKVHSLIEDFHDLIGQQKLYEDLNKNFKQAVMDLKFYLEEVNKFLETPILKVDENEIEKILEGMYPTFAYEMEKKNNHIEFIIKKLNLKLDDTIKYKSFYQKHLHPYILMSEYVHRAYFKPSGYAGDWEMVCLLHKNDFSGTTTLGKLINKFVTSRTLPKSIPARTNYVIDQIKSEAIKRKQLKILSIAAGPSFEFQYLLEHFPELTNNISVTLLDVDIKALQFSQEKLYENRIKFGSNMKINFIHLNIENYLIQISKQKNIYEKFDLIYSTGLFQYFDNQVAKFIINNLIKLLHQGGKLFISNVSSQFHNYRVFQEFGTEWYLNYRTKEEMFNLTKNIRKIIKKINLKSISEGNVHILEILS